MNGRMYDPILGRMLSVDNYIQDPFNTQSFNRYTYAMNNPMKYVDPDGEIWHLILGAVIGGFMNVALNGGDIEDAGDFFKYLGVGVISGIAGAGIGSGFNAVMAGGTFGSGFIGTSTFVSAGFNSGFVTGFTAGFSSGFTSEIGNSFINNVKPWDAIKQAFNRGLIDGLAGGVVGGIFSGTQAAVNQRNFWTGAGRENITIYVDQYGNVRRTATDDVEVGHSHPNHPATPINNFSKVQVTTNPDGTFTTRIKYPKELSRAFGITADVGAGALSTDITKRYITITSLNRINFVTPSGFRYLSNPVERIGDLFSPMPRVITWP